MRARTFLRLSSLALITAIPVSQASAFQICLEPRLQGYYDALKRAEAVLPENTRSDVGVFVYVEKNSNGDYYYQSNYIPQGYSNPTKLEGDEELEDTLGAFSFILNPNHEDSVLARAAVAASAKKATLILDKSVFNDNGQTDLNLDSFENITVVDKESHSSNSVMPIETRDSPPPVYVETVDGCCLFIPASYRAKALFSTLSTTRFSKDDVIFVSLVNDTATDIEVSKSAFSNVAISNKGGKIRREAELARIFEKAARNRKTVVLLGHTERGHYVTRGSNGRDVLFQISIDRLRELAQLHEVPLLDFGCDTAREIRSASEAIFSTGVISEINSVTAVKRLDHAMSAATNYAEFFGNLVSPEMRILLGQIPVGTGGVSAYHSIGGQLLARGATKGAVISIGVVSAFVPAWNAMPNDDDRMRALVNTPEPGPADAHKDNLNALLDALKNLK